MKNISVWYRVKEPVAEVVTVNEGEVEVLMAVPCPAWADKQVMTRMLKRLADARNL